jgi:hypothetical protein
MPRFLCLLAVLACLPGAAWGNCILLPHGGELTVMFSLPDYNPGAPPASLELQLWGEPLAGETATPLPNTTMNYFSGIMLQGWLESADGSVATPLFSADSWRLGLAIGQLVAESTYSGDAMIDAQAMLNFPLAQSIFGASAGTSGGHAEFVLTNQGDDLMIGLNDYSLANAVVVPMAGQVAAHTDEVMVTAPVAVPEPSNGMI